MSFTLELFSIIPKRCVDLKTNAINCKTVPTSGYYEIKEDTDQGIAFQLRDGVHFIQNKKYASQIRFLYREAKNVFTESDLQNDHTVIYSSESKVTKDQLRNVESDFHVAFTPAAWFTILQLNPNAQPFKEPGCRLEFAEAFRKHFEKLSGEPTEASVFTKLVAGYKTHKELQDQVLKATAEKCASKLAGKTIDIGFDESANPVFVQAIIDAANELGVKINGPAKFKSRKEEVDQYLDGKTSILYGKTGFWALDPTGDIQMLFTPNLHKGIQHFWNDQTLQNLLGALVHDGEVNNQSLEDVNEYLFRDGKFNVYSHVRRFYASKNKAHIQNLPIGVTSPSPWHLFEDDK